MNKLAALGIVSVLAYVAYAVLSPRLFAPALVAGQELRQPGRMQVAPATATPDAVQTISSGGDVAGWALSVGQTAIAGTQQARQTQDAVAITERMATLAAAARADELAEMERLAALAAQATQLAIDQSVAAQDAADREATREAEKQLADEMARKREKDAENNYRLVGGLQLVFVGGLGIGALALVLIAGGGLHRVVNAGIDWINLGIEKEKNTEEARALARAHGSVYNAGEVGPCAMYPYGSTWICYIDSDGDFNWKFSGVPSGKRPAIGGAEARGGPETVAQRNPSAIVINGVARPRHGPNTALAIRLLESAAAADGFDATIIPGWKDIGWNNSAAWQTATNWLEKHEAILPKSAGKKTELAGNYRTIGALLQAVRRNEFSEA